MPADPTPRRLHLFTAVILVAVFVAGAATGAGLIGAFRPAGHASPRPRPPGDGMPPGLSELGLSPDQAARARAILDRHRAELEAAIQETFPRVRAIQDRIDQEIRAVLTPDQAARLDELRRRRPPLRGMGGMGGPPPGFPGAPPQGLPPPRPPPP